MSEKTRNVIRTVYGLALLGAAIQDPGSWQFYVAIVVNLVAILIPVIIVYLRNRKDKRAETPE